MTMTAQTFTVRIDDVSVSYRLFETNAPPAYDAGATLTLSASDGLRHVLIEDAQVEWHKGRYASGLYTYDEVDLDRTMRPFVRGRLFDWLRAGSDAEKATS